MLTWLWADSTHPQDAGIEPRFRSRLDTFRGSGFDRGHMAPAANHKQVCWAWGRGRVGHLLRVLGVWRHGARGLREVVPAVEA